MNKNTTVHLLTGLILALASSGAMAQSALQQLGAEAGVEAAPLIRQMQTVRILDAGSAPVVGIRRNSKDVFAGCESFEAKPFVAWNLSQAALIVQPCLNNAYPADGSYTVRASVARFAVRACPSGGAATCRALVEVAGIKISVEGSILTGDSVLQDLNASIDQRGGKLLSYYATLDSAQSQILH